MELDIKSLNLESLPWLPMEENLGFPRNAAIYFATDSNGVIQYIGRSINPKKRWRQYHKFDELRIRNLGQIKISYLFIESIDLLPEIEKALILYFKPPLNDKLKIAPKIIKKLNTPKVRHPLSSELSEIGIHKAAHAVFRIQFHIIFVTKYRKNAINQLILSKLGLL